MLQKDCPKCLDMSVLSEFIPGIPLCYCTKAWLYERLNENEFLVSKVKQ